MPFSCIAADERLDYNFIPVQDRARSRWTAIRFGILYTEKFEVGTRLIPNQTTLGIPKMTTLVSCASGRRKGVATNEGLASTACQTYRFQAENSTARTLAKSNLSVPPNRVAR